MSSMTTVLLMMVALSAVGGVFYRVTVGLRTVRFKQEALSGHDHAGRFQPVLVFVTSPTTRLRHNYTTSHWARDHAAAPRLDRL